MSFKFKANKIVLVLFLLFTIFSITACFLQEEPTPEPLKILTADSISAYSVAVTFNNSLSLETASNIENYEITFDAYELTVTDAVLDSTGKTVTLTTDNSQIESFFWKGSIGYLVKVSNLKDVNGQTIMDEGSTMDFIGTNPTGIANWGDSDNYKVSGTVKDDSGNPIEGALISFMNGGADDINNNDDIELDVLSDENGNYQLNGLPSQKGINCDENGHWEFWVLNKIYMDGGKYENYWYSWYSDEHSSPASRDVILYEIDPDTTIEGTISNGSDELPSEIGFTLNRDDLYDLLIVGGGEHTDPDSDIYYNPETGDYHITNMLAGGTYTLIVETETIKKEIEITAAKGGSTTLDIDLSN